MRNVSTKPDKILTTAGRFSTRVNKSWSTSICTVFARDTNPLRGRSDLWGGRREGSGQRERPPGLWEVGVRGRSPLRCAL